MIVNGDLSQVDLPSGTKSGLRESINILRGIKDIGFIEFEEKDVVRNPLVSKIVSKYKEFERIQHNYFRLNRYLGKHNFLCR